jgi:hypothetical protein
MGKALRAALVLVGRSAGAQERDLGIFGLTFGLYAGCAGSGGAGRKEITISECPC